MYMRLREAVAVAMGNSLMGSAGTVRFAQPETLYSCILTWINLGCKKGVSSMEQRRDRFGRACGTTHQCDWRLPVAVSTAERRLGPTADRFARPTIQDLLAAPVTGLIAADS